MVMGLAEVDGVVGDTVFLARHGVSASGKGITVKPMYATDPDLLRARSSSRASSAKFL